MTPPTSSKPSPASSKFRLAVLLVPFLLLFTLAWANPAGNSAQGAPAKPESGVIQAASVTPTATLNPIPELNPNPRQTDGVIAGAAVIVAVILAGVWTYGRKRKE
jgi:hypothetical protein